MSTPAVPAIKDSRDPFAHFHPMEVIPYFRGIRRTIWRDIAFTFAFNCSLSLIFWMMGAVFGGQRLTLLSLGYVVLVSNVMGFTIHALIMVSGALGIDLWLRARGHVVTAVYYTLLSSTGIFFGYLVLAYTVDRQIYKALADPRFLGGILFLSAIISTILMVIFLLRSREAEAAANYERERLRAERVEREATHAQLRALQAQIEPHFLFNTLANVASLIDADPGLSKRMLERFIRFLRASLDATRGETTTLGAERELISAYLDVIQVRMGSRLRYAVDIAPELAGFALPPMLLQPVVENAIRHGVEPRIEGGEVALTAVREGEAVRIEIRDTGVGFASSTHGGTGLTNLRDRLKLLYGERASVTIGDNAGGGTIVTLRLPA
jgi:sensor histidine kinase YesM